MLTLTLRSTTDGRFLARIVEQQGTVFVLDYGDRRVIDDATQRINKGFTVFRAGKLVRAVPRDPDLLLLLGDYYAGEGFLVALEEPLWAKRQGAHDDARPDPLQPYIMTEEDLSLDSVTDILSREEADRVREKLDSRKEVHRGPWSPSSLADVVPTVLDETLRDGDDYEDSDTEVVDTRFPGAHLDDGDE